MEVRGENFLKQWGKEMTFPCEWLERSESDVVGVWRCWFGVVAGVISKPNSGQKSDDCGYNSYTRAGDFALPNRNFAS